MRSRIKYKPGELDPEIHLTLTTDEFHVLTRLVYTNLAGSHKVRDSLDDMYRLYEKVFGVDVPDTPEGEKHRKNYSENIMKLKPPVAV